MATRVKICGLKSERMLEVALAAGADLVGLVLFAPSPRCVDLAMAERLAELARAQGRALSVVLLVDADDTLIERVCSQVAPDMLQLHGRETPARVREVRARCGRPVMKALSVQSREEVARAQAYLAPGVMADMVLFDAKPPPGAVLPGGNGLAFDWHILEGLAGRIPFALSGGLNPGNVGAAIGLARPDVVDVSSGVERAPGDKDAGLIRSFIAAARAAG